MAYRSPLAGWADFAAAALVVAPHVGYRVRSAGGIQPGKRPRMDSCGSPATASGEFYTEKMLPGSKSAHTFPKGGRWSQSPLREAYHSGTFQSVIRP